MVRLNIRRAIAAARLDNVRVQSALDEVVDGGACRGVVKHACNRALKGTDKLRADGLALGFWVANSCQFFQEGGALICSHQLRAGGGDKVLFYLLALAGTQQAVVNEDTGEAIANGTLHQRGRYSGVHTAGQAANGATFLTHLCADIRDELLGDIIGRPILL